MYGVIIPNRFEDVIDPLVRSIYDKIPNKPPIVIIADGHERDYGFSKVVYDDKHFVFSRAINLGLDALEGMDVILLNDDCVVLEWNFFDFLHRYAYSNDNIGLLSPMIVGAVGNPVQWWYARERLWKTTDDFIEVKEPEPICFPCVYIKRKALDRAGRMNEHIAGYGFDDHDMCTRIRRSGFKTAVTQRLIIQHGDGSDAMADGRGKSWATSFMRRWEAGSAPVSEIADYLKRYAEKNKEKFVHPMMKPQR